MTSAVERTDELVREYLTFRGFTNTLKHFEADIKTDKEKGFRVDKIVEQLLQFIQSYDLSGLLDYWAYLERRLFSRLEDVYRPTIHKLKTSLFRYYLVYTVQTNKTDKSHEFFQKQATELQNQNEWKEWFALPFLPTPDQNPAFATYFSRQWADTFTVSLHNFLSVLFQCMPVPTILNFEAECQRIFRVQEENEALRQKLFALQAEAHRMRKEGDDGPLVHHKLPHYVSNMDRLGDSDLNIVSNQRNPGLNVQSSRTTGFLSSLLPQSKKVPSKPSSPSIASPTQSAGVLPIKKEPANTQVQKTKEVVNVAKETKSAQNVLLVPGASESSSVVQQRQRRLQERKELLTKSSSQSMEKKNAENVDLDPESRSETQSNHLDALTRGSGGTTAGSGEKPEQPFIVLSQDEYGEHHSSIMHCRVDCSGRRVASLDVDGVIKVWSIDAIMQTKASAISKSPLLSLEWATKRDRLLLLGSEAGTVRLYDTEAKKNLCEIGIVEDMPRILSLACSPSGASFVCSAAAQSFPYQNPAATDLGENGSNQVPGKLLLWDTKTMKQQLQFSLEPEPIAVNCTAFNHNGNLLVTGAADGVIRLFDMQQHQCAMSWKAHKGEVYSVDFSYDENAVYSIGEDGKFIQWNIHKSGQKVSEYSLPPDATGPFVLSGYSGYKQVQFPRGRLFAFDAEGKYMLTCSNTGGVIYKLNSDGSTLESCLSLGGHRAPVVTVDWSTAVECGTCLTASMDGKIRLTTLLAQKS
ncbi:WD repeat-containing protein 91 isoform X1 [Bombina bombina]|uniref:WD repeat-containing protein 91 isoform X1 n=1 Tax=Bombina bombina TaxID=8345 RepID=UPI00235B1455|nr:WD repeat-containing protein 91 isoform X1 [Bombina bombina]XP_053574952.1 WD repeat-containing protein 91 isoform X1 [Bombina bombina]